MKLIRLSDRLIINLEDISHVIRFNFDLNYSVVTKSGRTINLTKSEGEKLFKKIR